MITMQLRENLVILDHIIARNLVLTAVTVGKT